MKIFDLRSMRAFAVLLCPIGTAVAAANLMGQAGQPSEGTLVGQAQTPQAKPARAQSAVSLKNGRLSIAAQRRSVNAILDDISQVAKLRITTPPNLAGQLVSVHLQDLPLDEALRQILKDYDVFFFYGADQQAPASLQAVWVYAKGKGRTIRPVPAEQWASTTEFQEMLKRSDPLTRGRGYSVLIERDRDHGLDLLLDALKDPDGTVRTLALNTALHKDVKPPQDTLVSLALNDESPRVRFLALNALSSGPQVRPIAQQALSDPDVRVRSRAQEILDALDVASRSQKSPEQPRQPEEQ